MIKIIFWALLGYILYRWLLGNRLPSGVRNPQDHRASSQRGSAHKDGEIRVDHAPSPTSKSPRSDEGEYVDYEELD